LVIFPKRTRKRFPGNICLYIDLIGQYTIGNPEKKNTNSKLHCLTRVDPVTRWFEIAEIPEKTADEVVNIREMMWLVRYPRPTEVVMDRGSEFRAEVESTLREQYGIHNLSVILHRIPRLTPWSSEHT
jgi:hypothetical protein